MYQVQLNTDNDNSNSVSLYCTVYITVLYNLYRVPGTPKYMGLGYDVLTGSHVGSCTSTTGLKIKTG